MGASLALTGMLKHMADLDKPEPDAPSRAALGQVAGDVKDLASQLREKMGSRTTKSAQRIRSFKDLIVKMDAALQNVDHTLITQRGKKKAPLDRPHNNDLDPHPLDMDASDPASGPVIYDHLGDNKHDIAPSAFAASGPAKVKINYDHLGRPIISTLDVHPEIDAPEAGDAHHSL